MSWRDRRAVERGAAHLDKTVPQWWRKVNLAELDMRCSGYCVLGQVYGDYSYGLPHGEFSAKSEKWARKQGFNADTSRGYEALEIEWRRAIIAKKVSDTQQKSSETMYITITSGV